MDEVSSVVIDFGSTNSGCCILRDRDAQNKIVYTNPFFLHNTGNYAKDNTWIYFSPELLERIHTDYDSLSDSDFRIESRIMPNTENANVIWGRDSIARKWAEIQDKGMIGFSRFKMMFYHGLEQYAGSTYNLVLIIKSFLRVLKIEALYKESERLGRKVGADEILWGLTIPSIWTESNKHVMVQLACEVFAPATPRIISEPEGPLVYSLLMSTNNGVVQFENGRTSFVVDMGGGTTDICLMKEVLQSDGSFKMEMIANSDGSAAGGNDIDNAFYVYMLRELSNGCTSDAGVRYENLNDHNLLENLFTDFQTKVGDFIEFENNWYSLKNRPDIESLSEITFTFTRGYYKWLKQNGHRQLADKVSGYLLDGCTYPTKDFIKCVFIPTVKKICSKAQEIIRNNRDVRIDRVTMAGGLSCNFYVLNEVRSAIRSAIGRPDIEFGDLGPLMKGGAIMAGASYILLNMNFIQHLARKNYYFDMLRNSWLLKRKYAGHGKQYGAGYIDEMIGDSQIMLSPIFLKDEVVREMYVNDDLCVSEGQTQLSIEFYSSDADIVFSPEQPNTDLKKEAELLIDTNGVINFRLEVDFNQANTSDSLLYRLYDKDNNVELQSGFMVSAN